MLTIIFLAFFIFQFGGIGGLGTIFCQFYADLNREKIVLARKGGRVGSNMTPLAPGCPGSILGPNYNYT